MPIYEFICPIHGKFEKIVPVGIQRMECEILVEKVPFSEGEPEPCQNICERVEQEIPAKRNPRYGEG